MFRKESAGRDASGHAGYADPSYPCHGSGPRTYLSRRSSSTSENALEVEQGSLYPALHRLEDRGLLSSEWGVMRTIARRSFINSRQAESILSLPPAAGGQ